ncbi:membrane-bound lytic murein transglycosylase C [Shewanella carassii]|uniref:Membrane-bound lytic murein transglycosylase C n=1 Tax=Shewanella carassii TaxID=1987584 RepID=A0ABQ1T7L7_9GAMM|nr:membrane-bound lytic murein transglycosylase C [Shewanella carassii]
MIDVLKNLWLLLLPLILSACAQQPVTCVCDNPQSNRPPVPVVAISPSQERQAFEKIVKYFASQVKKQWGDDNYMVASKHQYVKYIDGYRTRAHIDFDKGKIWVSTVSRHQPKARLKNAIVETLLMPADPTKIDLFSDKRVMISGKPFLLGQVVDHDGKSIEWQWRANRFAEYLLANKLVTKKLKKGQAYYVEIDMVRDHLSQREYQYAHLIREASRRYQINEDLLYAIIKTESSFNPYAVSHAGAYGLMQVIPKTAGADVFKLIKNRNDIPTRDYLFDPANNIDTGAAYFHILKNRYLKDVSNPSSRHYSMISAYNGGTGGVLATFDLDRQRAMRELNALTPSQVYKELTTAHPKAEARRYLQKVLYFQKEFNSGNL